MLRRELLRLADVVLLLWHLIAGVVFITSGWNDLRDPPGRSQGVGRSKALTILLGVAEVAGALA
jgi:uncharacterized membrane protein YphA (DoxX/SURF4 family)